LALGVGGGTERFAVVEVSPAIPLAIPSMTFDVLAQFRGLAGTFLGEGSIIPFAGQLAETIQHVVKEECQPDAFPPAVDADKIHSVVPIATAHQRQTMFAEPKAIFDRANQKRRRTDNNPCGPTSGLPGSDRRAIHSPGHSRRAPVFQRSRRRGSDSNSATLIPTPFDSGAFHGSAGSTVEHRPDWARPPI